MDKDQKQKISKIFSELDKDNDGKLSEQELVEAFIKSGRTQKRS